MNKLKEEIIKRNITRICHFTRSSKLLHILSSDTGILATHFIEVLNSDILTRTDYNRFDGHTDYISCSVQYPNTWYLDRVRNQDPLFRDWVIIFINPMIILDPNTKFCHRNAAAGRGCYIRSGTSGFLGMFENPVMGQRLINRSPRYPDYCTTDGQAEVLVYKNIPRSEILGVAVPNYDQAKIEKIRVSHIHEAPEVNWIVAPDLFSNNWHQMVSQGQIPEENSL